ncbi:MAG: cation transporter [Planctomycetes bacterium]|nr:cation transporter [Planctomycetota bacterium]
MVKNPAKIKAAAAWLSVVSNTALVILKIVIGLLMGSVAVISEAIHSAIDLLAAIIAFVAVRTGSKPADDKHPFGHGKIENISGTIEALLIFLAAAWIIFEAVRKIMHPTEIEKISWGIAVMAGSTIVNVIVSNVLFRVGRATDSIALQADAWHLRTDVYTSLGVMVGLIGIQVGDVLFPSLGDNLHFIDPAVAIFVAMLIVHAAWRLTVRSAGDLLDANLPAEEVEWIRGVLIKWGPKVRGFHKVRTRKAGPMRFIEFHIFVDRLMTVGESHQIAHQIADRIKEHFSDSSVTIHVEPCDLQFPDSFYQGNS